MQSNIRAIGFTILAVIGFSLPQLHSQTSSLLYARVDVPFSFDYGSRHCAQGTYTLTMTDENILTLRSAACSARAIVQTDYAPARQRNSTVVFKKYGERYILEEVLFSGDAKHVAVLESGAEKRAARELATRGGSATQVALAVIPAGIVCK
jgi:hypothetical protein